MLCLFFRFFVCHFFIAIWETEKAICPECIIIIVHAKYTYFLLSEFPVRCINTKISYLYLNDFNAADNITSWSSRLY